MAIFNLSFAVTRAMIKVLRQGLAGDPLFRPDGSGSPRTGEALVYDAWGYQVRDFPIVVVTGVPGKSRRMDIADRVRPFYGVPLTEEAGGTSVKRTFDVPLVLVVDGVINLRYTGDNSLQMNPWTPWEVPVKQKAVGADFVNYIELVGNVVGPPETFPAAKFEASTKHYPTGQVFGGWYDMTVEVTACARSTQTRELLADRLWSMIWFTKKRELRKLGVVVLDVAHTGFAQEPYGADQLYYSKFAVSVATEFEAIVQFAEIVSDIKAIGTAVSAAP